MALRLKAGDAAPVFELLEQAGGTVRLADYAGKQQVLLVLLRGLF